MANEAANVAYGGTVAEPVEGTTYVDSPTVHRQQPYPHT